MYQRDDNIKTNLTKVNYYPYDEDAAGKFRGSHKTADAAEYLLASKEIISLARDALSDQMYKDAENTALLLTGKKKDKDLARERLIDIVHPPPKRPIYYAQYEIQFLPRWTRDTLRYLGDFIDMLIKSAVYEKTKDIRIFRSSLGPAITHFQKQWPGNDPLVDLLIRYNRFLYRGAKHDFDLPSDRKIHRFSSREVVLTAYITMEIAYRICAISQTAKATRDDHKMLP
jgi:hypothetical protein